MKKGYVSRVREKLKDTKSKLSLSTLLQKDTIVSPKTQKLDSLSKNSTHKIDSLQSPTIGTKLDHKTDSVNRSVALIQNKLTVPYDTVNKLASHLNHKLKLPDGVQQKADSLQGKVNNLESKVTNAQQQVQGKADALQNKVNAPIDKAQDELQSNLNKLNPENVKIPGQEELVLPKSNLPDLKTTGIDLPNTSLPTIDQKLPVVNAGNGSQSLGTDIPKVDVNLPAGVPDVKNGLSDIKLPQTESLDKIKDVSGEVNKLDGKLGEVEKYEADLQKLKSGEELEKLPEEAEAQFKNMDQMKGVNSEINKAKSFQSEQEALIQRYQNKKMLQEEITRKATHIANDYLAQNPIAVKSAQAQLAKSKSGFTKIKSVKDVFKRQSDELENKKFYQRLVPGVTFQIYNNKQVSIDLATQLGYRFSPKLIGGIGFIYRTGFSKNYKYFASAQGVYGGRAYVDFKVHKGIFAHGEFEVLNINPNKVYQNQTQESTTTKIYGSYFGLGNKFKVSSKIMGSVLGLYRVDYNGSLPAMNKINVRLGFDYVIKKRKKLIGMGR